MKQLLSFAAVLFLSPLLGAQTSMDASAAAASASGIARLEAPSMALPDAPSFSSSATPSDAADQQSNANSPIHPNLGNAGRPVAKKYASVILPYQTALPLTATDKMIYSLPDAFGAENLISIVFSAGYSQVVDSSPHYGRDSEAFGKRVGAAALRNTVQSLATDAVFSPIFHDDPRYYELGPDHNVFKRTLYAVSRVVVTRSDSGRNTLNAPLLLGYGVAAGLNNAIYPDQDTGAKPTFISYGTSLGGAAVGMFANEFLDDALRLVHLRK